MRPRFPRLQPLRQTALLAAGTLLLGMMASWAQSAPDLKRFRQPHLAGAPALRSVQGRPLDLYRFGEGTDEIIVLLGGFHGDEVQGEYMLQRVMARLAAEPALLVGRTIWCLPLVNPDGKQARRRGNARGVISTAISPPKTLFRVSTGARATMRVPRPSRNPKARWWPRCWPPIWAPCARA